MGRRRTHSNEQVLEAIRTWIADHGLPPTVAELKAALGLGSTRTALRYLEALQEQGDIERWPGARGMRVRRAPDHGDQTAAVPIAGRAPAGQLMVAEQNIEGWVRLPRELLRPSARDYFLLRVRGNSMNRFEVHGERIEDGDLVLVRRQVDARSGEAVVALIDGEATIKRLTKATGYVGLQPVSSESGHQPILVRSGFRVQGIVRRVFKRASDLLTLTHETDS